MIESILAPVLCTNTSPVNGSIIDLPEQKPASIVVVFPRNTYCIVDFTTTALSFHSGVPFMADHSHRYFFKSWKYIFLHVNFSCINYPIPDFL